MSLHKFAEQVASQGRGDDSLLVHMTPDEVQRLQSFAQANGRSLTINPTTGLPEAGMLSDLFKAIAPIALGAFLGPAGMGLTFGGLSSAMSAGIATGGITALATGSLSRGLMAGLGAYGGAGLGESLMGVGGNALVAGGAPIGAENIAGAAVPPIEQVNPSNFNLSAADKFSAGAKAVTVSPTAALDFAKQNLGNLGYAAAPILAGAMVPTTTKLPDAKDNSYIRQFDYNINPETGRPDPLYGMRAMTPIKASEFGNKTFQGQRDLFRQQNPNPYELGVGSLNQPPLQQPAQMNTGGIVALANGGINASTGVELAENSAGVKYAAANKVDMAGNIDKWIKNNPFATADQINTAITGAGLTQADVNPYLTANTNISDATRYALSHASEMPGAGGLAGMQSNIMKGFAAPNLTQAQIDAQQDLYKLSNADIQSPLSHGFQVAASDMGKAANYLATNPDVQAWINSAEGRDYMLKNPSFDASDIAYTHFKRYGEGEGRKFEEAAKKPIVCGPGFQLNAAGTACEPIPIVNPPPLPPPTSVTPTGFYGNNTGNPLTSTPGDITRNPDGTVTVQPNIPGRPDGGFTGMGQVRDAYTAGGGSLGYTASVPKTAAEHNAMYNKLTDDSLDAYNFLMGKGKNLTQRKAETRDRPVMQRYDEAVLGRKIAKPTKTTTTDKVTTVVGVPGQPRTYFNEAEYLAANPDVAAEIKAGRLASAYDHWLMYGKAEGRPFPGDYQGYLTAAALANAAGAGGGGDGPAGPSGVNNSNPTGTVSNQNIGVTDAVASPAGSATPSGGSTSVGSSVSGDPGGAPSGGGGDNGDNDARGGYYSRGKLNYRQKDMAVGGATGYALGGLGSLGSYSDGGRLLRGPGDGVSDSIPATIGRKNQPARLADGEFVIPARIVSELGNGSTDAGAKKLYAMMDRVQRARGKTTGKNKVAANSRSDKYLPA